MRLRLDPTSPNGVSPAPPANDGQNVVRTVPRLQRLNDLEDVRVDGTPSDKQALAYDAASNKFIPQTLSAGGTNPDGTNATNLSSSTTSTTVTVASDTGTDATLTSASSTQAGVLTASDKTKLDGIEAGAQVNTVDASDLAPVATSGAYSDLSGKPTIPSTIVQSITAGSNITIDSTDPAHPVVNSTATGGGSGSSITDTDTSLEVLAPDDPRGGPGLMLRSLDADAQDRYMISTGGLSVISHYNDDGSGPQLPSINLGSGTIDLQSDGYIGMIAPSGFNFQTGGSGALIKTDDTTTLRTIQVPDEDGTLATTAYVDAHAGGGTGAVSSVNTKTGAVVLTQDDIADGTTAKQYTATEKTKLAGIETGAQVNTVTPSNTVALTNKDFTGAGNVFPTFNQNTTGTASNVTGTVTVAKGGTGRTTATTAYGLIAAGTTATGIQQTIAPGTSGQFLKSNGTAALGSFANITEADVTNLTTDLAAKVPTTTTVNGHALSANVTVTATDVGLGNVDNTSDATKNSAAATLTNKTLVTPLIDTVNEATTGAGFTAGGVLLKNGHAQVLGGATLPTTPAAGYGKFAAYGTPARPVYINSTASLENVVTTLGTNSIIQSGWGFEAGNGTAHTAGKTVTFPAAFSGKPIVMVSSIGYKDTTDPVDVGDFSRWEIPNYNANGITTTGFGVIAGTIDGTTIASTRRVGYSWIAIGPA